MSFPKFLRFKKKIESFGGLTMQQEANRADSEQESKEAAVAWEKERVAMIASFEAMRAAMIVGTFVRGEEVVVETPAPVPAPEPAPDADSWVSYLRRR